MHNGAFQSNKVRRAIRTQGRTFSLLRAKKNEFNEPTDEEELFEFKGLFHDLMEHKFKATTEATTVRQRSAPMILTLWEGVEGFHQEDRVRFNNKVYRISNISNLGEANLVADISLEEVQT